MACAIAMIHIAKHEARNAYLRRKSNGAEVTQTRDANIRYELWGDKVRHLSNCLASHT